MPSAVTVIQSDYKATRCTSLGRYDSHARKAQKERRLEKQAHSPWPPQKGDHVKQLARRTRGTADSPNCQLPDTATVRAQQQSRIRNEEAPVSIQFNALSGQTQH